MKIKNRLTAAIFVILILTFPIFSVYSTKRNNTLEAAGFYESPFASDAGFPFETVKTEYKMKYPTENITLHQEVTIGEYNEWLSAKILKGEEPDVFFMTSQLFSELYDKGVVKKIIDSEELNSFCYDRKTDSGFVKSAGYGEEIYAIPVAVDFNLMAVNKKLLTDYGIDKINDNWTWSDYQRLCKLLNKENAQYGFDWEDAVYSNGGKVVDYLGREDYLNSLNVLNAVNFVYRLNEHMSNRATIWDFIEGKVAIEKLNVADCINMNFDAEEIDYLTMPAGPEGGNISKAECIYVCIGRHSENVKEALKFIDILLSDRVQSEIVNSGYAMSVKKLSNSLILDETVKKLCALADEVLPNAFIVHRFRDDKYIFDIIDKRIEESIYSGVKPDNALSELHLEISDFLNKKSKYY